jgi:hypothetical protein
LKHQFRSLDEDEIDFLDSVLETERAKETATKKETAEQLDIFRRHQEEEERQLKLQEKLPVEKEENPDWTVGPKKRKKAEKEAFKGIKLRKNSSSGSREVVSGDRKPSSPIEYKAIPNSIAQEKKSPTPRKAEVDPPKKPPTSTGLGLVAYSSDTDTDDD